MPNTIRFYANFTPNLGRGQHYYFDNVADYLSAISSHAIAYLNNVDNYRVTSNLLRIPYPITQGDQIRYEEITYLSVLDERINLYRFYHVKAVTYLSNYLELTLQRDLWADYIALASLDHIFVKRCNKLPIAVTRGQFENIDATMLDVAPTNNKYNNFLPTGTTSIHDAALLFTVVYQTYKEEQIFGGQVSVSSIAVYAIKIDDLVTTGSDYERVNAARAIITSIYGVDNNSGGRNDAILQNIWLIDYRWVASYTEEALNKYNVLDNGVKKKIIGGGVPVQPDPNTFYNLEWVRAGYHSEQYTVTQYPNKIGYFGTVGAMLELPRTFDSASQIYPSFELIIKDDGAQFLARVGDNQLDISTAFSLGIPAVNGEAQTQEKIARGLSTVGALVGAGANIAMGNYVGGALGVATALVPKNKPQNAQYNSNGDGIVSFFARPDYGTTIRYPLGITYYTTFSNGIDAKRYIAYAGFIVNQLVQNIAAITNATDIVNFGFSSTFVQASIDVEDVPIDAANYIAQEFENGLELIAV